MNAIISKEELLKAISSIDEQLYDLKMTYKRFEGKPFSELSDWEFDKVNRISDLVMELVDVRKKLCYFLLKWHGIFVI